MLVTQDRRFRFTGRAAREQQHRDAPGITVALHRLGVVPGGSRRDRGHVVAGDELDAVEGADRDTVAVGGTRHREEQVEVHGVPIGRPVAQSEEGNGFAPLISRSVSPIDSEPSPPLEQRISSSAPSL